MYVLLKDYEGRMIVRRVEYWDNWMQGANQVELHTWKFVTTHVSSSALLKMIEIATDAMPEDEKKRQEHANNTPEHVNKVNPIH